METNYSFTEDDMEIEDRLGFPRAYAQLCRERGFGPYCHGPPYTFNPYLLQQNEGMRAAELDQMFPVIDPRAKPTAKPKIFVNLLWKQLSHLGNAGFDPAVIRVDPYGNVLYFHADSASPLAWDIDHWFPCSRGGLTVPSNLRLLQWQVCKRKHNKLEFLVPWWDLQLGISVNQFLSIFASSNSDFRHRAFYFLFSEGENEELNASQTVDSHSFPKHFVESKEQVGLAPAAIVASRSASYDSSMALKSLDYNRLIRPHSPAFARKAKGGILKENDYPDFVTNPYQAIVMARDSLKQREENQKMQGEIQKLDDEVNDLKTKNEEEKLTIQELELTLIKRRRRAEKCRRLAEAQCSYRTMLEKMIRDAMHQSVIYKEQLRLNQAASNALMARLEAQKAICDAAEKELHKKFKQRDELEKQVRPEWEQARKRSRMDDASFEERRENKTILYLPGMRPRTPLHKELRVFLEEEHRASEAGLSSNEERRKHKEIEVELQKHAKYAMEPEPNEQDKPILSLENETPIEHRLQMLEIEEGKRHKILCPVLQEPEIEEDEESRKQRGKGNVERWLQLLLENNQEEVEPQIENEEKSSKADETIAKMNLKYPIREIKPEFSEGGNKDKQKVGIEDEEKKKEEATEIEAAKTLTDITNASEKGSATEGIGSRKSFEGGKERKEKKNGKERVLVRSESARTFRRIPSSPSLILGMKKGVDCIRKKPIVSSDDDIDEDHAVENSFIKSSFKTFKKAMKI
ncbi:plectin [Tripterygium wilfordii]|uniref:Plectin n=1 Tax=Tripterygium wilfordii TaxID=458696 RepID=A0A7J7BYZ0_TRIWF|nr:uncharacterized protein LOC119991060 isoform X2 [Tripterygium wilfordii]KAF5726905.1 plectin [Tripterygium wilfordii]